ncbi:hypothetical protein Tco_0019840 [Tanacetum coccineum]
MATKVSPTIEYTSGQLNVAPKLDVKNFINWKKRFMCHIVEIEPQFKNIILIGPYVLMADSVRKPEAQWSDDERICFNIAIIITQLEPKVITGCWKLINKMRRKKGSVMLMTKRNGWSSRITSKIFRLNSSRMTDMNSAKDSASVYTSSAPANGNKNVPTSKKHSALIGKLKDVKTEVDIPITDHRTCDHAEYMSSMNMVQHLNNQGEYSSRSQSFRPLKPFPPCKLYGFNDQLSDDCRNYPTCEICRSYDHDTKGHNRIISLRRRIKPRNPQSVIKCCETCGSIVHTTTNHNDTEWFRRGESLQAKKA